MYFYGTVGRIIDMYSVLERCTLSLKDILTVSTRTAVLVSVYIPPLAPEQGRTDSEANRTRVRDKYL